MADVNTKYVNLNEKTLLFSQKQRPITNNPGMK
jgi:hypothetical protein